MKQCPTCKSIVNAENACPICKTSLVYEPSAHTDNEHIVYNRYFALYLLKTLWISMLTVGVCGFFLIGWHATYEIFWMPIVLFAVLSFICGLSQRHKPRFSFYTDDAFRAMMILSQYLSAVTALFFTLIPILLPY